MLAAMERDDADMVLATRYAAGGSTEGWDQTRTGMSRLATTLSSLVLKQRVSDPMSGFFMLRRHVLDANVRRLSALGFKILLDILATSRTPLKVVEVPYTFRDRFAGESKLDSLALWDFGMLLADKTIGRFVPVRFVAFAIVGGLGVFVHMVALSVSLKGLRLDFLRSQAIATVTAMIFNFARQQRADVSRSAIARLALVDRPGQLHCRVQHRGDRERWRGKLPVPGTDAMGDCGPGRRGGQRCVELRGDEDVHVG